LQFEKGEVVEYSLHYLNDSAVVGRCSPNKTTKFIWPKSRKQERASAHQI